MVASLAALSRLKLCIIKFQLDTSRRGQMPLPPATRAVLPALISFQFVEPCGGVGHHVTAYVDSYDTVSPSSVRPVPDTEEGKLTLYCYPPVPLLTVHVDALG